MDWNPTLGSCEVKMLDVVTRRKTDGRRTEIHTA